MRKLLFLIVSLAVFYSCMKDEDYTLSANDTLRFSTDTVAFDTIISGIPTNTYTFTVYNPASKALRIPEVSLGKGEASPFKVTVDGMPLIDGVARDFEIASKDSMIVYLFANLPEQDSDLPIATDDKLIFTTEAGVQQNVVLTASGQAVIPLTGERISQDTVFDRQRPYQIMDSLVVEAGKTLTLNPGTRLYFHPKAQLIVHGTLKMLGNLEKPVELRGDRLGDMFDGQPYDRIPGQWGGVTFTTTSYHNYISYADIHSGQYGIQADSSDVKTEKLRIENSIIHNTSQNALSTRMSKIFIGNSQITNAGNNCVKVRGGDVTIVHSTIARFYVFTGGNGVALDFSNHDGNIRLPLEQLSLINTIVTGYQSDEIMGSPNSEYENDAFNYHFTNCLLNTIQPEEDNGNIVNCQWDTEDSKAENDSLYIHEKNFLPTPDLKSLTFSFELNPKSQAVGNALKSLSEQYYPTDRLGRKRQPLSDIGCYQHQDPETK